MPRGVWNGIVVAVAFCGLHTHLFAQVVPGSGTKLTQVGDDFEDESFTFTLNLPKASSNIDKVDRQPAGFASNNRWYESMFRGTPDLVKRCPTPAGGLPGSKGSLMLRTVQSGVPGRLSREFQQDDLLSNFANTVGFLPAHRTPSVVTRVYLPAFERWEQRTGSHFGFRIDCQTIVNKQQTAGRLFRSVSTSRKTENYWPGFFLQYFCKKAGAPEDYAMLLIRSGSRGEDINGPIIKEPGWWTLGMTVTPDGRVHYYGHAGVEKLTAKDHLYSSFPYGYTAMQMNTFFYNIVNMDDGRSWSTEWIVDDAEVFVLQ